MEDRLEKSLRKLHAEKDKPKALDEVMDAMTEIACSGKHTKEWHMAGKIIQAKHPNGYFHTLFTVGEIANPVFGHEVMVANTVLASTAPELLDALKQAEMDMDLIRKQLSSEYDRQYFKSCVDRIVQVIDKAEGRIR